MSDRGWGSLVVPPALSEGFWEGRAFWRVAQQTFVLMDVLKTSFVFVFRKRLQDVLIKTNIFTLVIHLQKTSSRHLQDVLKRCLQDVFKRYHQVKLFLLARLRRTPKDVLQKIFIYRRICLGHTPEKFNVSVQNLQE